MPERSAPPKSKAPTSPGSRNAAAPAVALVLSRYAGCEVANHNESGVRPTAPRRASLAASTPSVVVSSSCEATARAPVPPPLPMKAAMSPLERRRYGT